MKTCKNILLSNAYDIFKLGTWDATDGNGLAVPIEGADVAFGVIYGVLIHAAAWISVISFILGCIMLYFAKKGGQLQESKMFLIKILFIVCAISGFAWFIDAFQGGIASL